MRNLLLTFCCAISLLSLVRSQSCQASIGKVKIICASVEDYYWPFLGHQLTCEGDRLVTSTFPDSTVSSVVHSNRSEVLNHAEIGALSIEYATVRFVPRDMKRHLLNLKGLHVFSCGLLTINKDDLKAFGYSLELLWLGENKLTSIDADLFDYNPNLEAINLSGNPIRHIEPEFFTSLKDLKSILFVGINTEGCIDQWFDTQYGDDIATFKWNNGRCFNETARVETQLAPLNARVQQSLNNELCLEEINTEMQEQMSKMSRKFEKFKCQMNSIEAKLEILIQHIMNI